jgi:hypothetical protein
MKLAHAQKAVAAEVEVSKNAEVVAEVATTTEDSATSTETGINFPLRRFIFYSSSYLDS